MMVDNFGAVAFSATFSASADESNDAGLDPKARFLSAVAKTVLRSFRRNGEQSVLPSIFYLQTPGEGVWSEGRRHSLFRSGVSDVGGRFWLVAPGGSKAWSVDHQIVDGEALISAGRVNWGLQSSATIVLHKHPDIQGAVQLVFFPDGTSGDSTDYSLLPGYTVVEPDAHSVVEHLYENSLRTPGGANASVRVWSGTPKKPIAETEKYIQGHIRSSLVGRYPWLTISEERQTAAGRYDLSIALEAGGLSVQIGLLELKVLRPRDVPIRELAKGVRQAKTYSDDIEASWKAVYCFDMMQKNPTIDVFAGLRSYADAMGVVLRSWHLFEDSEAYRRFLTRSFDPLLA
ncbi:hypothetical protein [Curtobacterium flaccumfaciens]|uniref:hypothetical protein n=1 Tax=Curtobacterium flaccumfaciens TaxID=2035 RepID=UPI003D9A59F6